MFRKSSFVVVLTVSVLLVLLLLSTWFARAGAPPATPQSPDTPAAVNMDDRENTTPTDWWVYSGQTVSDIANTLTTHNARIIDIYVESLALPRRFTVTYVSNTGAYAKDWWWYFDVDETALSDALTANNARLISLKAYDIGGGQIRFAAVMIPNTDADAKDWWWYYGKTTAELTTLWQANTARIVQINSYVTGGQTKYAAIMISNADADAKDWWWYVNATPADIESYVSTNNARLIDLDRDSTTGNYNLIMESCATGCPLWWWYTDTTEQQLWDNVAQDGSRIFDLNSYPGCGSLCYSYLMINNSNDITSRVGDMLRSGTDGVKGLYLKEVDGPVLANLEESYPFEPASSIKAALHLYTLRQVQAGTTSLSNVIPKYMPPVGTSCPGNTLSGSETISTALREMMWHSDNTRTREISDTFGVQNINTMMTETVGMSDSRINHILGCGGPTPNQTTLDDMGRLYEKVANGTLLNAANRDVFFGLMAGKSEYQQEGYDWTHLWDTDIPAIINQEAPAGISASWKQAFKSQMNLAYKAGDYKLCTSGDCATYVDHISIAGWVEIPFCGSNNPPFRQYVFGLFIYNSTNDTTSNDTFNATKAELLREQIHAGLASCLNQVFLPLTMRQ